MFFNFFYSQIYFFRFDFFERKKKLKYSQLNDEPLERQNVKLFDQNLKNKLQNGNFIFLTENASRY